MKTYFSLSIFTLICLAGSVGHRIYTYVEYVPREKWLTPGLLPATITIGLGAVCLPILFALVIQLYRRGVYYQQLTPDKAQYEIKRLESKLEQSDKLLQEANGRITGLINSKSEADLKASENAQKLERQKIRTAEAKRDAVKAAVPAPVNVKANSSGTKSFTPPSHGTVNVTVENKSFCGSCCGAWFKGAVTRSIVTVIILALIFLFIMYRQQHGGF